MKSKKLLLMALITSVLLLIFTVAILPGLAASDGESAVIRLQYATFDPLAGEPALPDALTVSAVEEISGAAVSNVWLVQFAGPVQQEWKDGVEAAGARLYGYIPENAFLARMDASTATQVAGLSYVRWIGPYHPAYRLAPTFYGTQSSALGDELLTITVQALPDADVESVISYVEALGGEILGHGQDSSANYWRLQIDPAQVSRLALHSEVLWVEPYFMPELQNDIGGSTIMRASEVRSGLRLYGQGQIVAVADSGLDVGTTGAQMSADFRGRIVAGQAICAQFTGGRSTWSDLNAHGTHVAGSVLGSGSNSGSNPGNQSYAGSFAGVAPEALLIMQAVDQDGDSALECIPDNLGTGLFKPAYDLGARIHTNSWGGPTGGTSQNPQYGGYTSDSRMTDTFMWQNRDMLILFAAGNSGRDGNADGVVDPNSIGSPGTSKNVLTVGATENFRPNRNVRWGDWWPNTFPAEPIFSDLVSNNAAGLAAFSSRGPASDGRIKPEVVAPGTMVISSRSQHPSAGTGWGVYNQHHLYMGGTSMATPLVAGGAALVREWLVRIMSVNNPSAALMKAILINGARNIAPGQYGTGARQEIPNQVPNNVIGWGRVDLMQSLSPPPPQRVWFKDNKTGVSTGGSVVYTVTIGSSVSATAAEVTHVSIAPEAEGATITQAASAASFSISDIEPTNAPSFVGSHLTGELLATSQLLQNPGFESGWTPWQTFGSPTRVSDVKRSGNWSAHFGNRNNANDQVWQAVNIPANASDVKIDFWYRLATQETLAGFDFFCYGLWHESGSSFYLRRCVDFGVVGNVSNWTRETYTLTAQERSAVAGRSVLAAFILVTDGSDPSRAWVDDTALNVTTPDVGTATPTPTPTRTPTPTATPTGPTPTPTATVTPLPGNQPLRVTLAWTDYPASAGASKTLVNDLDLEVIAPGGASYVGNQGLYTSGQCLRGGKWDACNNVEGVLIPSAAPGTYRIIIRGANVPQGPQPFAVVATGASIWDARAQLPRRIFVPDMRRQR